jgi:serine protease Do
MLSWMRLLPIVLFTGTFCGAPNGSAVAAENAAKSPQNRGSEAQLAYASGLIDDGLFDAALQSLRSLPLGTDAQVGEAFLEMVKLYGALGNTSKAHDLVEQAQALLPEDHPRLRLEQARLHLMVGNLAHARQILAGLRASAQKSTALQEDVVVLQAKGHLAVGGLEVAQKALRAGPSGERLVLEEAKLLAAQRELKQAKELLEAHTAREPNAARVWLKLADIAKALGDQPASMAALDRASKLFTQAQDSARLREVARLRANAQPPSTRPAGRLATPQQVQPPQPTPKQLPPAVVAEPSLPQGAKPLMPPIVARPSTQEIEQVPLVARPFPFPPTVEITTGSGFVIDGGRRVITNKHVIEGVSEIYVRNSLGDMSRAKVERTSKKDDLAVLVLDSAFPSKRSVSTEQFAPAKAGASIAVIGFPMTDILGSVTPSITNGIVTKETGMQDAPEMFQLSAKMNKGNSGGAVVDSRGRVVGVAMGKLDTVKIMQGGGFLPEDINFAIHVNRLKLLGIQSSVSGAGGEMSLEDIYQQFIGSVVMVAGR